MKIWNAVAVAGVLALNGCNQSTPDHQNSVDGSMAAAEGASSPVHDTVADANGNMHVPANYRANYEFLGTWAVAADAGKGDKQLHIVYASPGSTAAFKKSGHFPDGTVLVKEVYDAAVEQMTTGTVSHEDKLKGWFVMVRDTKNSHPDNKLWGDGWGWSWFDADKPNATTSTDYASDCKSCHIPAQGSDWVYSPGYPPLKN